MLQQNHKLQTKFSYIQPLAAPKSVIVAGVSETRVNPARIIYDKFAKSLPTAKITKSTNISDLQPADLAVIAVPKNSVLSVIESLKDKAKAFQVITAGFEEAGDGSLKQLKNVIQGSNCVGSVLQCQDFTFLGSLEPKGSKCKPGMSSCGGKPMPNISVISQSGAFLGSVATELPVKFGFSIGNQSKIRSWEYAGYCCEQGAEHIVLYLESVDIQDAAQLSALTKQYPATKFIFYRSVKSKQAEKQAQAHTGSGSSLSFKQLQSDLTRAKFVDNLTDLFVYLKYPQLRGEVLGLSQSGFVSAVFANNLRFGQLNGSQSERIQKLFTTRKIVNKVKGNLDTTPMVTVDDYAELIQIMTENDQTLVVSILPELYSAEDKEKILKKLESLPNTVKKNIVVAVETDKAVFQRLEKAGFTVVFRADSLGVFAE